LCEDEKVAINKSKLKENKDELKRYISSLFQRREDSFLVLLNDNGIPLDLRKTEWIECPDPQLTVVFSEASPSKKPRIEVLEQSSKSSHTKQEKLVRLFKNVKDIKTEPDGVEVVKPDLPLEKKYGAFGQVDLRNSINFDQTYCLNESGDQPWSNIFQKGKTYLESDIDEQLLLNIRFAEPVNLHSFLIKGLTGCVKEGYSPGKINLYFNDFNIDFDSAENLAPKQTITLTKAQYMEKKIILFDSTKWQNTTTITFFVVSNVGGESTTIISSLKFFGKPAMRKNFV
jgi:hypothetical protein